MGDSITLEYDLLSLPTAQHKAGLAGLVMSIQEMWHPQRRESKTAIPESELPVLNSITESSASITLTEQSCQHLFDDCYAARMGTVTVKKQWKNAEVREQFEKEEEVDGKTKKVTYYVHPNLEPHNPFLARYWFRGSTDSSPDLYAKLWRDMLWQIPRAKPTTRNPYKETEAGEPCKEGAKIWKELKRFAKDRADGKLRTAKLSSSLFLGAQDSTAENVGFLERSDLILALNFWPLATLIYVPFMLDIDAAKPKNSRTEAVGFSLIIPDIQDLQGFCNSYPKLLSGLRSTQKPQGYRPKDACIELPEAGAIDFLSRQAELLAQSKQKGFDAFVHAVEYRHVAKFGNNVKSLGCGRFSDDEFLREKYQKIQRDYRSPLFRSVRLNSLFENRGSEDGSNGSRHWWQSFEKALTTFPHELFMANKEGGLPSIAWAWCRDVRKAFETEKTYPLFYEEIVMNKVAAPSAESSEAAEKPIEILIKQIVQNYIRCVTEKKSKVEFKDIRQEIDDQKAAKQQGKEPDKNSGNKSKFEEQRRKTAEKLFLEFRSRHGEDFAAYFAEVFGSQAQWSIYRDSSFQLVCKALLEKTSDIRTITLLAISASS